MTNYDPYEQDREDNRVREFKFDWDNSTGAYSWEWEPDAIDRKNAIMRQSNHKPIANRITKALEARAVQAKRYWEWKNNSWSSPPPLNRELLLSAASALLCIFLIVLAIWVFLTVSPANGQELLQANMSRDITVMTLPDMPEPKPAVIAPYGHPEPYPGRYWDRTNVILASSMVAVGSFDLAQTCHSIANGGREVWMPMKTCGSLVGVGVAMGLGMTYLSYQLHRHGHHRLERIPFIGMIAGNTAGITYSKEHGAW